MAKQFDDYRTQILSLSELIGPATNAIADRGRLVLPTPDIYGIRQIILTGSGDSYFAAVAAAPALRAWTGLPVQAMVSMEAARYVDAGVPPLAGRNRGLLVVSVSSSGEGARLVEATQRLRRLGALTLAVTANPSSRVGQAAEKILDIAVPPSTPAPGTRSYLASLLGLYLLGIRLAEVLMSMTMDAANALRSELAGLSSALAQAAVASEAGLAPVAETWREFAAADCLGSGPSFGSASFAAAKLVEAAGLHAVAQDAEEFHHLNFFAEQVEALPAIVFAPGKALSATRVRELCATLAQLGRPYLVVTDDASLAPPDRRIAMPAVREWFAPIVHMVPASFLAAFWAEQRNTVHYRGQTGAWRGAAGAALVRNSAIELEG